MPQSDGPPPLAVPAFDEIFIPPARTPPDDRPEDYPAGPPRRDGHPDDVLADAPPVSAPPRPPVVRPVPAVRPVQAVPAVQPASAAQPASETIPASTATWAPYVAVPAGTAADRRQFHRAGVAVMGALLAQGQIMEVADVLTASPVQLALERADDLLGSLVNTHEVMPPAHVLAQTGRLRRGLERLGTRSMTTQDSRQLLVLAGRVAVLGADAAFKLGDVATARRLTADGYAAGIEAGDGPLCGSAREVGAVNEFYGGRPDEALRLARDGLRQVGHGPVRARLVCQQARALAALGDVRGAAASLDQAYDLADEIPVEQWGRPGPGFDSFHPVEVSYNATTALCLLGRPRAAQEHAELALPQLDGMNAPGFRSVIRFDLALAMARQGRLELDGVCELATDAIGISWGRTVASVSSRADQLLAATAPHGEVRQVRELASLVREWQRSAATQRPNPSTVPVPADL